MCKDYSAYDMKLSLYNDDYWNALIEDKVKEWPGRYRVMPTNAAPVVWQQNGQRRMSLFEFGMMPHWGKSEEKQKRQWMFFNARDDKLLESNLWEPCLRERRCLVPANGFFEPHNYPTKIDQPGGKKPSESIPFYFRLKSSPVFSFAGIWDEWTNKETGEVVRSFSIITTGPNRIIKKIHNKKPRTPLILAKEDYDFWLGEVDKPEDFYDAGIFQPWSDDDMEAWQVSKELDYGGSGPELIAPVENPVDLDGGRQQQGSLFE